jgi:hypothetical protein
MKIIITGHTSNIGKMLFEYLSKNHECLGFSKSTGCDLNVKEQMDSLIKKSLDSDCLINLAHIDNIQSQILININEQWSNHRLKNVITFGTLATKIHPKLLESINANITYLKQKHHLDVIHNSLSIQKPFGTQVKFTMLRIANYGPKTGERSNEPTCSAEDITRTIDYILNQDLYISNIDLRKI